MHIRPATLDDISDVVRLLGVIRQKTVPVDDISEIFDNILASKYADVLLAVSDDKAVGMAIVNGVLKLNRIECRLDDVVVDPEARKGGIGTALMAASDQWAWDHGCYKIEFTSRAERVDAVSFYEKRNYERRASSIFTKISPNTDYVKTKVI